MRRASLLSSRTLASLQTPVNLFQCFPQAFPNAGPPHDSYLVNVALLRREYRLLQSISHPDKNNIFQGRAAGNASLDINRAYSVIKNPYLRAAHAVHLHHPSNIDISQDDASKAFLSSLDGKLPIESMEYKRMLMEVLEVHESLQFATGESDLKPITLENEQRMAASENAVEKLFRTHPVQWDALLLEIIRLKYWVNIDNAIRNWEPGKPIVSAH